MERIRDGSGWHPGWEEVLAGLTAAHAAWQPAPGRNSIRQIVNHVACWADLIARRLGGEPHSGAPIANAVTFVSPGDPRDEAGWQPLPLVRIPGP